MQEIDDREDVEEACWFKWQMIDHVSSLDSRKDTLCFPP